MKKDLPARRDPSTFRKGPSIRIQQDIRSDALHIRIDSAIFNNAKIINTHKNICVHYV